MVMKSSSRGTSYGFAGIVKPDIMAPGSLILGVWNPNISVAGIRSNMSLYSDYYILSGTSPATVHVAGVTALLKATHPNWSPAALRSAIVTTANLFDNSYNRILDGKSYRKANPLAMGLGLINPNKALDPGLIYDATSHDYVNLLCSYLNSKQISEITRSNNYSCANPSKNLNYPSFILLYGNSKPKVRNFERIVTNAGKDSTRYKVVVKTPKNIVVVVRPEILVFERKNEKISYNVTSQYTGGEYKRVSSRKIVWVEENGEHTVRNPIVVSPCIGG